MLAASNFEAGENQNFFIEKMWKFSVGIYVGENFEGFLKYDSK